MGHGDFDFREQGNKYKFGIRSDDFDFGEQGVKTLLFQGKNKTGTLGELSSFGAFGGLGHYSSRRHINHHVMDKQCKVRYLP